jgi:cobalt-zinc-cadmium efflux system outer membrane protein
MVVRTISTCVLVALLVGVVHAAQAQAPEITLSEALRRAAEQHPDIRLAQAEVRIVQGQLRQARTLTYNPEVSASIGSTEGPDTSLTSYEIELSQRFEIGGKRGARTAAARWRVEAAEARLARTRELVAAQVVRAFTLAALSRARIATTREAEQVAAQLKAAATERLALGAGTQLELNVATAAIGRDRRSRLEAERTYASALFELAAAVGLPARETVIPAGEPPPTPEVEQSEEELVKLAVQRRTDLTAARAERAAAAADLRFARALFWPDPAIGVSADRDDLRTVRFGVSLPLPLWNRGQGERAAARAAVEAADLTQASVQRQIEFEVRDAYQSYLRARQAESGFDRETVNRLAENITLASESFRSGKIGLLVFSTVRRDLVDARLAYLDALADVAERRYALQLAIGGTLE